jgi:hypothetical protein
MMLAERHGKLLFWLGLGAAQKGAGSKPIERRNWVVSLVGALIAAIMIVAMFLVLVSQKLRSWGHQIVAPTFVPHRCDVTPALLAVSAEDTGQ